MPQRLPPRGPLPTAPTSEPEAGSAAEPRLALPRAPNPNPVTGAGQFDLFAKRSEPRALTVGELTREVKGLLEGKFPQVWVKGELSNVRAPSSGHLYFTLKDDDACIDAVLFRTEARRLRFTARDGLTVLARGRLSLYEPQGKYQIICDSLEPLGAGALQLALEQLKEKLKAEGLFDRAKKRRLPFLPRRIAIVTSPSGAAVHDFIRVLHRRFPNLQVLVVPTKVQGEGAAQEIARAIGRASVQPLVDVVVVARGGGSAEDLWSFNEEVVARALAACPVPTVSAVGHEVDVTLADLVADVRAPTPTAAAEILSRVKEELVGDLAAQRARLVRAARGNLEKRASQLEARRARLSDPRRLIGERKLRLDKLLQRLEEKMTGHLDRREAKLRGLRERLDRAHPRAALHRLSKEVSRLEDRLTTLAKRRLAEKRSQLEKAVGRLDAMSPLRVLARGYSVAFDVRGHALRDAREVQPGDAIHLRLAHGSVDAQVTRSLVPQASGRGPAGDDGAADPLAISRADS
jgi:exodeoxyribonuclease VII large subunit